MRKRWFLGVIVAGLASMGVLLSACGDSAALRTAVAVDGSEVQQEVSPSTIEPWTVLRKRIQFGETNRVLGLTFVGSDGIVMQWAWGVTFGSNSYEAISTCWESATLGDLLPDCVRLELVESVPGPSDTEASSPFLVPPVRDGSARAANLARTVLAHA